MAPAVVYPSLLVVFEVIHHAKGVNDALAVIDPGDQPVSVIAYIECDAVSNAIRCPERSLKVREISPLFSFGHSVPRGQVAFGCLGILFSGFPEFT
jgi:hypothetical protein